MKRRVPLRELNGVALETLRSQVQQQLDSESEPLPPTYPHSTV